MMFKAFVLNIFNRRAQWLIFQPKNETEEIEHRAQLRANTIWGVLKGMESFSQLVYKSKAQGYLVSLHYYHI